MSITFKDIFTKADQISRSKGPTPLILYGKANEYSLRSVMIAEDKGWIRPVFALSEINKTTEDLFQQCGLNFSKYEVLKVANESDLLKMAVAYADENKALIMRGRIHFTTMIDALFSETDFAPRGSLVSHIGFFESDKFGRIILITDGGVNIRPTLEKKPKIVQNAINAARRIGIEKPKAALLAAVEAVYIQMEDSLDDAVISKMADRGVFGDAYVDGPLSLDVAIRPDAAKEKKVTGQVAGNADILIVSRIEVGNGLYKALFMFGKCKSAGILVGGKFPVVLTSRSQDVESRINSIAIAIILDER